MVNRRDADLQRVSFPSHWSKRLTARVGSCGGQSFLLPSFLLKIKNFESFAIIPPPYPFIEQIRRFSSVDTPQLNHGLKNDYDAKNKAVPAAAVFRRYFL